MILSKEELEQRKNKIDNELEILHSRHRMEIYVLYDIWKALPEGERKDFIKKQGQRQAEEVIKVINLLID